MEAPSPGPRVYKGARLHTWCFRSLGSAPASLILSVRTRSTSSSFVYAASSFWRRLATPVLIFSCRASAMKGGERRRRGAGTAVDERGGEKRRWFKGGGAGVTRFSAELPRKWSGRLTTLRCRARLHYSLPLFPSSCFSPSVFSIIFVLCVVALGRPLIPSL